MRLSGKQALPDGRQAEEFLIEGGRGMRALVSAYGARLLSLQVPRPDGTVAEVLLGHAALAEYTTDQGYLGATIGRYANRLAGGRFRLDGQDHQVPVNNPPDAPRNALHGGPRGFDQALWQAGPAEEPATLTLRHRSPDGDQGFPGELEVEVRYSLSSDGALGIGYVARTSRPTIVNLTNHSYFNLLGEGADSILDHELAIAAETFTPVDAGLIPTGELRPVEGTPFDFRAPHRIGMRINADDEQLRHAGGYDHNFVLTGPPGPDGMRLAARLTAGGLTMTVRTTEPGLQFYSGNFLDGSTRGRRGEPLGRRSGLCLETQHFPDSPNYADFPPVTLRPGEVFRSRTEYRFS